MNLIIKETPELTESELTQLNEAAQREFKVSLPLKERLGGRYFFLIEDNDAVLAMGQLLPVEPVIFNNESFLLLGIGGIIANEKGKGYGKQVMQAIKEKLSALDKTGVGFCKLSNKGFYEKCGFQTDTTSLKRLIHKESGMTAAKGNECLFYRDSTDRFIEKLLKNTTQIIELPTPPDW